MQPVLVRPVQQSEEGDATTCSGSIEIDGTSQELWWRIRGAEVRARPESLLAAALLPAMLHGRPIRMEEPVSPRLLGAVHALQDVYTNFWPRLQRIEIEAPATDDPPLPAGPGVGTFFSGGVDGLHTLVTHESEITHIVPIHGIDYEPSRRKLVEKVRSMIARTATESGTTLVDVETNFREYAFPHAISDGRDGMQCTLAAGLAATAYLLQPTLGTMYVPSSSAYADLVPFGSHPLIDPLWSLENLALVHDGAYATRYEKIEAIAAVPYAMRSVRYCGFSTEEAYNCGRCRKCARTLYLFEAVGARPETSDVSFEEALAQASDLEFKVEVQPRHWYHALLQATERMDASGKDTRRLERILRGWTFLGRRFRKASRREVRRIMRRVARGAANSRR